MSIPFTRCRSVHTVEKYVRHLEDAFLFFTIRRFSFQVRAQAGGGELIPIDPRIIAGAQQQASTVTKGLGGRLAWPGLLRMLDRDDHSYRT